MSLQDRKAPSSDSENSLRTSSPRNPRSHPIIVLDVEDPDMPSDDNSIASISAGSNNNNGVSIYGFSTYGRVKRTPMRSLLSTTTIPDDFPDWTNSYEEPRRRHTIPLDSNSNKVEWFDTVRIPRNLDRTKEHIHPPVQYAWKGALWSIQVVVRYNDHKVGVFIGYDKPDLLPAGWKLDARYTVSLLDDEGKVVTTTRTVDHMYKAPSVSIMRCDYGYQDMIDFQLFKIHTYPVDWESGEMRLKVDIIFIFYYFK
ncbi:MATH domain-containing protein [archaeon]|nr:MAG: MATH domain-containing protein [archaeon]